MASMEEIKQRLTQIISDAQAQGYDMKDVMLKEMQEHVPEHGELNAAREKIQELETNEKKLQAANETLQVALMEKEAELADQPEDFQALKIDLRQALHHVDWYKQLAEDSQRRADRYQQSMTLALKEKLAYNEVAAKNEELRRELTYQQSMIRKLQDENRRSAELFEHLRAEDQKAMAANEAKLVQILSHASQVETESEAFSEVFSNLIETLESENVTAVNLLNERGMLLRKMETLYNVVVSEAAPLKRFFGRAFHILQIYQILFQKLSDPYVTSIGSLPRELEVLMQGASEDLHAYHEIHDVLSGANNATEDQLRIELGGMSKCADGMLRSLIFIKSDVEAFLARLHAEPKTWVALKARFGGNRTTKMFNV